MVGMTFMLNVEYMFDFFQLLHDPNMLHVEDQDCWCNCLEGSKVQFLSWYISKKHINYSWSFCCTKNVHGLCFKSTNVTYL